jgi:Co/Zn/Cd efflux system component
MRRYLNHDYTPLFKVMIIVSFFALIANVISLILLQKNKSEEAHMKAVLICTSSDVLVNAGVILAGILVYFTQSFLPDLIIGFIVFFIVGRASFKILELSK